MEYLLVKPTLELIKTTQGGLLFDKSKGKHLLITPTEAVILSLCDGSRTVDEVIDYVSSLYNEPKEKCANDVKKFVSSASGNVLISIGRQVSISSDFPSPHIFEEIEIEDVLVPEKIITLGISP